MLQFALTNWPKLFNWIKLRRVRRKINSTVPSLLYILLYIIARVNRSVIHNKVTVFKLLIFIQNIQRTGNKVKVMTSYSTSSRVVSLFVTFVRPSLFWGSSYSRPSYSNIYYTFKRNRTKYSRTTTTALSSFCDQAKLLIILIWNADSSINIQLLV